MSCAMPSTPKVVAEDQHGFFIIFVAGNRGKCKYTFFLVDEF
jgi:hypothetical protein